MTAKKRLYPDSRVELTRFGEKYYDIQIDISTFGIYRSFIKKAVRAMNIRPGDKILDLGCGTGRNDCLMAKYLEEPGGITGLDISDIMQEHFGRKCRRYQNVNFIKKRIDQPFYLDEKYDKVFISFVIHGFPQDVRQIIIQNAVTHLKKGGTFNILDYSEFDINSIPFYHRYLFNSIEGKCKYAYDFIKKDWKKILQEYGFTSFKENYFIHKYVRLLTAYR